MALATAKRKDFLRHIVNRVLAGGDVPKQIVDDIRRHVGRAEDKYKFHAFGGDIKRLADYLRSREFDDLIAIAKSDRSGKGIEVLKKILLEAKEAYKDIPEVVQAIEERLKQLESLGKEEAGEAPKETDYIEELYRRLEKLAGDGVSVARSNGSVNVAVKTPKTSGSITVTYDESKPGYRIEARIEVTAKTTDEAARIIKNLVEASKQ